MHTRVNKNEKQKTQKIKIIFSGFSNGKGTRLGDARLWHEL